LYNVHRGLHVSRIDVLCCLYGEWNSPFYILRYSTIKKRRQVFANHSLVAANNLYLFSLSIFGIKESDSINKKWKIRPNSIQRNPAQSNRRVNPTHNPIYVHLCFSSRPRQWHFANRSAYLIHTLPATQSAFGPFMSATTSWQLRRPIGDICTLLPGSSLQPTAGLLAINADLKHRFTVCSVQSITPTLCTASQKTIYLISDVMIILLCGSPENFVSHHYKQSSFQLEMKDLTNFSDVLHVRSKNNLSID